MRRISTFAMWNNYFTPTTVLVNVNDFFLVLMTFCIYYVRVYTLTVLTTTVDILIHPTTFFIPDLNAAKTFFE